MQKQVSRMPRSDMIARDMGPGNIPKRPDIFGRDSFLFGRRPQGNLGSDFRAPRMPQKRGGGFGGSLREAIRRLKEERDMGMPKKNFGDQIGYTRPNKSPRMPIAFNDPSFRIIGTPQPIARRDPSALERLPMGEAPSFNPTIFGQPIPQGADFGNMPDFSQIDMSNLDLSGIPQSISQMDLPQMPEGLPSMEEIQGGRSLNFADYKPQDRMMMAGGDEVFMPSSPEQIAFSDEVKSFADYQPEGSLKGTFFDYIPDGYQVSSFLMDKFGQEAAQDPTIREMFEKEFKAARMAGKDVFEFMGKPYNTKTLEEVEGMRYGGEMERFQDGGEIDAMLSGMGSEEAGAMEDLEQMAPEMEMIDQLVNMVVQMIQQGAGEEEVIGFLREQGLDDEDIGTVLQLVAEMAETEDASMAAQNEIGADLEQLG
jgi:hypothetical protein